jgi:hypothetical protein
MGRTKSTLFRNFFMIFNKKMFNFLIIYVSIGTEKSSARKVRQIRQFSLFVLDLVFKEQRKLKTGFEGGEFGIEV